MEISITYRHVEPNESLKQYVEEKVSRIKKYIGRQVNADVILSMEKKRFLAEVNVTGDGIRFNRKEVSPENLFNAIDLVMDKVMNEAVRSKTKRMKRNSPSEFTIRHNIISFESQTENREPRVIKTENQFVKPMTVEEAIVQLELIKAEFLVFTNAQSSRVNVLYQRRDGNYGLIETEQFSE
jgi:putative sigma-54 modulation protein